MRRALVTGGNRGIGRAIAEGLKAFSTYRGVDAVVPRARITDLVRECRKVGADHDLAEPVGRFDHEV